MAIRFYKILVSSLCAILIGSILQGCKKKENSTQTIGQTTDCGYNLDESVLIDSGWTKIFEDDFTGDLSKWNIWTGGAYNNELQMYQAGNLFIKDGVLQIIAKKEKVTGPTLPTNPVLSSFSYTSGRIESKYTISADPVTPRVRIIARLRLPSGYGMWPAFWSYGDPWPTMGEIDYMEARGNEPNRYLTNYYYGSTAGVVFAEDATGTVNTTEDLSQCYHVFAMEWTKNSLNSYLDGKLVETKTQGKYITDLFGKTERIVLNLAIGGGFFPGLNTSLIQTGTFSVDWVKVFTSK